MAVLYILPQWFFKLNIIFEIIFFLCTAIIAIYSFKIYKLSEQKQIRNFAFAFSFLSLSYFILSLLNSSFLYIMTGELRVLDFYKFIDIKNIGVSLYIGFFILGFISLLYATLKLKSIRIYIALLVITALAIRFSCFKSLTIYLITSLFLILITFHYFREYIRFKNENTLLVGIAMLFLLISNVLMSFVGNYIQPNLYVISRLIELLAYALIITSLYKIVKNGKKKKQA